MYEGTNDQPGAPMQPKHAEETLGYVETGPGGVSLATDEGQVH